MQFPFKEKKAAQAAAYLVWRHGGDCDYYALIKLLYLADREALVDVGSPITGDRMCSLRWGPILSYTMNRLNDPGSREGAAAIWNKYLHVRDDANLVHSVVADQPDLGQLSEYDLDVLDAVDDEHGDKSFNDFVQYTHQLPEFRNPGDSMLPIEPEEILQAEGKTPEEIHRVALEAFALLRAVELVGESE